MTYFSRLRFIYTRLFTNSSTNFVTNKSKVQLPLRSYQIQKNTRMHFSCVEYPTYAAVYGAMEHYTNVNRGFSTTVNYFCYEDCTVSPALMKMLKLGPFPFLLFLFFIFQIFGFAI